MNESKSKERKHLSMHGVLRLGRSGRVERDLPICMIDLIFVEDFSNGYVSRDYFFEIFWPPIFCPPDLPPSSSSLFSIFRSTSFIFLFGTVCRIFQHNEKIFGSCTHHNIFIFCHRDQVVTELA